MTEVINNSIEQSIFPSQWKIAKICPIPKTDIPLTSKNFRQISLLPVLSKFFECTIIKQLCSFIEDRVIYSKTQLEFRKHHSINTLLIKIRGDISNVLDWGEVRIAVMTDFSKAFDTLDCFTLICSYVLLLQYVQVNEKFWSHETVNFGVRQGSILIPILFNIYVSGMKEICDDYICIQ